MGWKTRGRALHLSCVEVARLQSEVCMNSLCCVASFLTKKCSEMFPKMFEPLFPGSAKKLRKGIQAKDEVFGQDVRGTSGTPTSGYPSPRPGMSRTKTLCKGAVSVVLGSGRDVPRFGLGRPGSEKLYTRKPWADFSCPVFPQNSAKSSDSKRPLLRW